MTYGAEARLDILRRDAEQKILEPLRRHKWDAKIEREAAETLIIVAERGGHTHRVALIYSSSTANAVYKALATQVEHIFFNGAPYHVEQYAYGIAKPVTSTDEFHSVMLEWNKASADGKFAPGNDEADEIESGPPPYRFMLAEQPLEAIWLRVRQFQSVKIAKQLVLRRAQAVNVELSDGDIQTKAEGLAFTLRNALDYFQAKEGRNVSQRILNLYYGTLAFAFAEMLAAPNGPKTLAEIEAKTTQGHGLFTIDGPSGDLDVLVVGVISQGFFTFWTEFLGHSNGDIPGSKARKFEELSFRPRTSWHSIEELFASIPEVSDLFRDIFDGKPRWVRPVYDQLANASLRLGPVKAPPQRSYVDLVDDSARLTRQDIGLYPGPIGEIGQIESPKAGRVFRVAVDHPGIDVWWNALPIHHSPFERDALIMPIFGVISEYRVTCLALLYALSIVVRYRPSVWRRVQEGDLDHMRVLIEAFLAVVERVLPEQFLEQVIGQRVFAKMTGSFY
ncbi:YaaC family protein [Reyranella sp.]|jgi:hypothetical protein|uniref:YaaC family protein n=1 Tax=Reyranella sp. TaxID=1929291 RepID=UPI003BAA8953